MKKHGDGHTEAHDDESHYGHLVIMIGLSFVAMYVLMYAMVASFSHALVNINQFYMAGLMAAPMALIELWVMRAMYRDRRKNLLVMAGSVVVVIGCWLAIRTQAGVGDRQFLRSMIPHHSAAILMCRQASIRDAEIQRLCGDITSSQQREIDAMQAILDRPGN